MSQHTRLSIVVIVVAAVLLQANTALEYFATRRSFNEQLTEKAQRDLNESHRIALMKQQVEGVVTDALPTIGRYVDRQDTDSLRQVLRQLTASQEQIAGVAVAFVPGYIHGGVGGAATVSQSTGQSGCFGINVYEDGQASEGLEPHMAEQVLDFDYTQRSWYQRAMQGHAAWSEPYEAKYLFALMCAYSVPVRDSLGRTMAVVEADVPLRELSAMAAQFYENQERAAVRNIVLQLLGLVLLGFIIWRAVGHLRRLQTVNAEKERIASELGVARGIQESMIPKTFPGYPDRDDVELFASLTPAREVGGDFYDFLIRGQRLFFCIGDVSGKGVPAALLMTVMRSLFRTEAGRDTAPPNPSPTGAGNALRSTSLAAAIVQRMNATLTSEQSSGYFATMFVGVLDLATGQLDYCNAGHEQPVVISNEKLGMSNYDYQKHSTSHDAVSTDHNGNPAVDTTRNGNPADNTDRNGNPADNTTHNGNPADNTTRKGNHNYSLLITNSSLNTRRNLPVGALPDWTYEGQVAALREGDVLFLYTDGLSEARDQHGHSLSRRRVADMARQSVGQSPRELVEQMAQEARRHADGAEQSDDITLMAIRWQGRNTLTLQADGSDLSRLKDFMLATAQRVHLDEHQTQRLRLAVEEAVTNVVHHAHATTLTLASAVLGGQFLLTITDDGRPFDPTTAPVADTSIPADLRDVGGLGLLFIRQMSDTVSYRREEGQNVLTIQKRMSDPII